MNRAAFLDRDGVLNTLRPGDYVKTPAELEILPGAPEAVAALRAAGYLAILISNQQGVSKGVMTQSDLDAITEKLRAVIPLDDVFYCTHLASESCPCRKPAPGMILAAVERHQIDLASSVFFGDSDTDEQAAMAAGVNRFVRVTPDFWMKNGPLLRAGTIPE
ncbi:MAG: HAD family hydrolase [Armatimonas sp.]